MCTNCRSSPAKSSAGHPSKFHGKCTVNALTDLEIAPEMSDAPFYSRPFWPSIYGIYVFIWTGWTGWKRNLFRTPVGLETPGMREWFTWISLALRRAQWSRRKEWEKSTLKRVLSARQTDVNRLSLPHCGRVSVITAGYLATRVQCLVSAFSISAKARGWYQFANVRFANAIHFNVFCAISHHEACAFIIQFGTETGKDKRAAHFWHTHHHPHPKYTQSKQLKHPLRAANRALGSNVRASSE